MTTSDLRIPRTADILDRALDARALAVRQSDPAYVRQIDRLITKLPGARICWQLGTLHIGSPSGNGYQVTRGGCSCLNAQRCSKRACWHVACFELLLAMLETEAETADQDADCDAARPAWRIGAVIGARIAAARRNAVGAV
jgi:hypothetical protein